MKKNIFSLKGVIKKKQEVLSIYTFKLQYLLVLIVATPKNSTNICADVKKMFNEK